MDTTERLGNCGIIPVVTLENAEDAIPLAEAMLAGGVDVMEITFRTQAAGESIRRVAESCPDMLVGAGTVTTVAQCREAAALGARFIVGPGFHAGVAACCAENGLPYIPGCVTPTEIMAALEHGLNILKYFPANVYGGLKGMKALAAPFPGIRFVPTGGVSAANLEEYITEPCVFAVGGSWVCRKEDIREKRFAQITELCAQARKTALGYEFSHVGINPPGELSAQELCESLREAFGLPVGELKMGFWAGKRIEVLKEPGPGRHGHFAVLTNSIPRAVADLTGRGYEVDPDSAQYVNGKLNVIYLKNSYGGFAVHLLQK